LAASSASKSKGKKKWSKGKLREKKNYRGMLLLLLLSLLCVVWFASFTLFTLFVVCLLLLLLISRLQQGTFRQVIKGSTKEDEGVSLLSLISLIARSLL
jgi:hypothetical protein